jgi:hypothetical protein
VGRVYVLEGIFMSFGFLSDTTRSLLEQTELFQQRLVGLVFTIERGAKRVAKASVTLPHPQRSAVGRACVRTRQG